MVKNDFVAVFLSRFGADSRHKKSGGRIFPSAAKQF